MKYYVQILYCNISHICIKWNDEYMIEFHSIGSNWFNVNFVDQQCCSFCSSTFKQCVMVHGTCTLKWAIKHVECWWMRIGNNDGLYFSDYTPTMLMLLIKECFNLLNPVSLAFSSSQQENIYNTCQKSWNTLCISPSPILIWVLQSSQWPKICVAQHWGRGGSHLGENKSVKSE